MKFNKSGIHMLVFQLLPLVAAAGSMYDGDGVNNVQVCLHADEVMVQYTLRDSVLQIDAIAREAAVRTVQSVDPLFWESLRSFTRKLRSADVSGFLMPGEILYLYLVKPMEPFLAQRHRLIIIPDEHLTGLPFEALICGETPGVATNPGHLHYLIHDFDIVYQRSREDWLRTFSGSRCQNVNQAGSLQFSFVGFAPGAPRNKDQAGLTYARNEVEEITRLFRQEGLPTWVAYGDHDVREGFMRVAGMGNIIHLAAHFIQGRHDHSPGYFLFSGADHLQNPALDEDGTLPAQELTSIGLEADLIVLNACSSGVYSNDADGTQNSLPQILRQAGTRNILSTCWNIADNLAADFILDFYRLLISGKPYSEALREVKLQWISCRETSLPTVWATYVLTGR
jgi:CHAT domain-containing protein